MHPDLLDLLVYGQVVPSTSAPNIAREVVLRVGLPDRIDELTLATSGGFWHAEGQRLPW